MRSRSNLYSTGELSTTTIGVTAATSTVVATWPGLSTGSITTLWATWTGKEATNSPIPVDRTDTSYVPGGTVGKKYTPSLVVLLATLTLVAVFFSVTLAPGMTALL